MKEQMFHMGIAALVGFCIFGALVALIALSWRKSGIGGFGLLALVLLMDRIAFFVLPFAVRGYSLEFERIFEIYFNLFMFALQLVAWWQIYTHFKRARAVSGTS